MSRGLALIIEDDVDLSFIFAESLRAAGFESEIVRDGAVAEKRLAATEPEVVVLDLHLPNVSGEQLLTQIRRDGRLVKTRVILCTADPRMAEPLQEIADLVLIKPIIFSQLRDLASRLAGTRND
ncbi:MAG: response regulator [Anaerolineae bacterium]|nr:response regulator [Anaerolineae bacterium]